MCGIAGFYAPTGLESGTAKNLARAMLYYAAERGTQSGGAWVDGRLAKRAIDPFKFACTDEFEALFPDDTSVSFALLHTRQPTSGGRDDAHAQPFVWGDTVTIHNGVISNHDELKQEYGLENPSGVDSELIAEYAEKYGAERLPEFFKALRGSMAVACYQKGRLYLAREFNPLTGMYVKPNGGHPFYAFASTDDILLSALRYLWLLPNNTKGDFIASQQIYKVRSDELKAYGKWWGTAVEKKTPVYDDDAIREWYEGYREASPYTRSLRSEPIRHYGNGGITGHWEDLGNGARRWVPMPKTGGGE